MIEQFISFVNENKLGNIITNSSFKELTTIKIGGKIKCLYMPNNIYQLSKAYKYIIKYNIKFMVIGNGSNVLASDNIYEGIIIKLSQLNNIKQINDLEFKVEAGVNSTKLALELANKGYTNYEFISTIPGTIGGMICMNAGAYGKEIKDIIKQVTYLDEVGNLKTKDINQIKTGYRISEFNNNNIIVSSIIKVEHSTNPLLPFEKIKTYKQLRKLNQPVGCLTAGSTFKNISNKKTWELIESVGLRGYQINGAIVSNKHANFLINYHNASFNDMEELIKIIKDKVFKEYNIILECEWVIVK